MNFKDRSCLCYDYGLFCPLAERLTQHFGRVGYFAPYETSFADGRELMIGYGLDGIERVKYFDKAVDEYDLIVFPDCHDGWLQKFLRDKGYRVFGSGLGAEVELARWKTKQTLIAAGLPMNESHQVVGTTALREFFKEHPDKDGWFVKISGFRGLGETWHARDYGEAAPAIDEFEATRGVIATLMEFVVEKSIPKAKEIGYDGLNIRGQFPTQSYWGIEKKDKSYFGKLSDYSDLPDEIKAVNAALNPTLEQGNYCNFFSTELRNGIAIDITARHASPAGEPMVQAMTNLAEVLWYGAEGKLVEPDYSDPYSAQIILCSEWATEHWQQVNFPEEIRPNVKLYNHCRGKNKDGEVVDWFIPQIAKMKQIGSVVALGKTPDEAVKNCKAAAEQVTGFDIETEADSLDEAMEEMSSE